MKSPGGGETCLCKRLTAVTKERCCSEFTEDARPCRLWLTFSRYLHLCLNFLLVCKNDGVFSPPILSQYQKL